MLKLSLRRHNEELLVKDLEIFDATKVSFRYPNNVDAWFSTPTGGAFRVEGDLQIEICEAGPSDPIAVYIGGEVVGGPRAATLKGVAGESVRIPYGIKPYIFVSPRRP